LSKFGRSFSILRVPYSLKLLIQELQVMNVPMRIITDENVDQLLSMSYSDNINKLLQLDNKDLKEVTKDYTKDVSDKVNKDKRKEQIYLPDEPPSLPDPAQIDTEPNSEEAAASTYRKGQEVEVKNEELREFNYAQIIKVNFIDAGEETYDVRYSDGEIEQQVPLSRIRPYNKGYVEQTIQTPESSQSFTPLSPVSPGSQSYVPNSPEYVANSPEYVANSPQTQVQQQQVQQQQVQQQVQQQPIQIQITTPQSSILEVQPPPKEESKEESKDENANSSSSETKQINISSDTSTSTDSTKKITL
jgi:hypothetical protein